MTLAFQRLGRPYALRRFPAPALPPVPPLAAPISAVAANGWEAEMVTPADLAFAPFTVQRQGFDANGNTVAVNDVLVTTKRVRQVFPNHASLKASAVALSDYLLAGDSATGVINNSTLESPKPIVNWVMQSRRIVGNTLRLGVTGNHWFARNKKTFACVEFTVTDGTTTVTAKVSEMTVSTTGAGDLNSVLAYETDIDISSLANPATITANAKVYPHVGGPASVADSSTASAAREFSPRIFRRDTARFAAPNLVRVASGGNDTTGYVGTDPALAAASPCATVNGAINRARAVLGTATGSLDGLRVQLTEGSWTLAASPTANTVNFEIVIEPAPGAAKANTIYNFGAANLSLNQTYVRFRGLTINRAGTFFMFNGSAGFCVVEDCAFVTNGTTGAIAQTAGATFFWNGVAFSGSVGSILSAANPSHAMIRGVEATGVGNWHGYAMFGSRFTGGAWANGSYAADNSVIQFNSFRGVATANAVISLTATLTGFSSSQNLIEVTHTTTSTPAVRPSSDGNLNSLTHVLFDNPTVAAGHFQVGRGNLFYDETIGTNRTHTFCRTGNAVWGAYYIKSDVFVGVNGNGTPDPVDAPNHIGNWAQLYGVGWRNVHTLFAQPGTNTIGNNEGPAFAGVGSSIAASTSTPQYPLTAFTNWQATTTNSGTSAAITGAGGGDYTLPGGSTLLGRVASADEVFPRDLDGNLRTRGAVGAYA